MVCIISLLAGCGNTVAKDEPKTSVENPKAVVESPKATEAPKALDNSKVFNNSGMNITLTKDFRESPQEGYTACYESNEVAVLSLKEAFADYAGLDKYTLEEYGAAVLEINKGYSPTEIKETDGVNYFTYSFFNPDTNQTYKYFSVIYKAPDAFWVVQFATYEDIYPKYEQQFFEWAVM